MAKSQIEQSSQSPLANLGLGPKLIGVGVALFVLTRIINWLPLGWIDGPINGALWLAILATIGTGVALTYLKAKRS